MNDESGKCIAPELLKKQVASGMDILIIDVRSKTEFDEAHIPLSLNIPLETLETGIRKFNKHFSLVTVCCTGSGRSEAAAEKLQLLGREAKWLCGGTFGYLQN